MGISLDTGTCNNLRTEKKTQKPFNHDLGEFRCVDDQNRTDETRIFRFISAAVLCSLKQH